MIEIGSRTRKLPAPPAVVWASLVEPWRPGSRPWLTLLEDEVQPRILTADKPSRVAWSSLWPNRPDDEVQFELSAAGSETSLRFGLLTPADLPEAVEARRLRRRLSELLFADLRYSYGQ